MVLWIKKLGWKGLLPQAATTGPLMVSSDACLVPDGFLPIPGRLQSGWKAWLSGASPCGVSGRVVRFQHGGSEFQESKAEATHAVYRLEWRPFYVVFLSK